MNNELATIWKEVIVVYFKVLSQHLPRATDENKNPQSVYSVSGMRIEPETFKI
jgi:hypothetical protein